MSWNKQFWMTVPFGGGAVLKILILDNFYFGREQQLVDSYTEDGLEIKAT